MKATIVTGVGGFIGSHYVELFHKSKKLILIDSFIHKGLYSRLDEILPKDHTCQIIRHDLNTPIDDYLLARIVSGYNTIDIINFASDSAVERSISNPGACWHNNCNLILNILEMARKLKEKGILGKIVHISTDETTGDSTFSKQEGAFPKPSNIYAASKVAQEALCYSYKRTYDLPIIITNCVNNYGFRQDMEKFIPIVISNLYYGRPIQIYLDDHGDIGKRYYLHCYDHCLAIEHIMDRLQSFTSELDRFNICGVCEYDNKEVVDIIAYYMNITPILEYIKPAHRKGYDSCYRINDTKLACSGWNTKYYFPDAIEAIIDHSLNNPHWIV